MARKNSGENETGRLRQQRYRQRLMLKGQPEVAELDTAVAAGLAQLVLDAETGIKFSSVKSIIDRAVLSALDDLEIRGYDRPIAARYLRKRLTWLKNGLLRGMVQ